ncbi:MAG: hypothetical protein AAGD25_26160 [Cyanobacteria bacterium P01_F01_bin.150]
MTIQQTIESLIKGLPLNEVADLEALIQSWPVHDEELQQLLEANTGEILQLFQQSQLSSEAESSAPDHSATKRTFSPLKRFWKPRQKSYHF